MPSPQTLATPESGWWLNRQQSSESSWVFGHPGHGGGAAAPDQRASGLENCLDLGHRFASSCLKGTGELKVRYSFPICSDRALVECCVAQGPHDLSLYP